MVVYNKSARALI